MFKFSGKRPENLGSKNGRFTAAPTWKPNWVSSQVAAADSHFIAPLAVQGDAAAALQKLKTVLAAMPRAVVVESRADYLYVEFSTPLMGYTDDVEFVSGPGVIHVRSSSRLGIRDFSVNRKRVEAIRAALNG
mgnify:CR=1 FL=1